MNYKVGDKVYRKEEKNPKYAKKYIYIGIVENSDLRVVRTTHSTMGTNVTIGAFTDEPIKVKTNDDIDHHVDVYLYHVELFVKEEEK